MLLLGVVLLLLMLPARPGRRVELLEVQQLRLLRKGAERERRLPPALSVAGSCWYCRAAAPCSGQLARLGGGAEEEECTLEGIGASVLLRRY